MSTRALLAGLAAVMAATAACGGETPTAASLAAAAAAAPTTIVAAYPGWVYNGTLSPMGSDSSITFPVATAGAFAVTLGALALPDGTLASSAVTIGAGLSDGTNCVVTTTVTATPGLVAQETGTLQSGLGCLTVTDVGGLPAAVTYTVRVLVGALTSTAATSPETFTNFIGVGGTVSHTVTTNAGAISASLTSLATTGTKPSLILGIGLYDGSVCRVSAYRSTTAGGPGVQVASADPGQYCVSLTDPGVLTTTTSFSISITHQ